MTRIAPLALAVALLFGACGATGGARTYSGTYLSLGDSIAAGNGASDPATTSFAALLAHDEGALPLQNLAVAGATTRDVIEKQLPAALAAKRPLAFVTISVGGNDLAALIPNAACTLDPLPPACPLDAALAQVGRNLDQIMKTLRGAFPTTPIVVLLYPNFFSGTGVPFEAPAQRVLPRLDDVLARTAARYQHTGAALTAAAFEGRGATLTHVLDPHSDPHPNDAGHRLIADAFIAALKRVR
ncbi:MAG TPA: GDSL-type esterase/lipase family protein [Dehalococcoidia bacterium]|nr:GDSL-type esterase/lipase family protein [Dehalococcoidia bacterium]